MQLPQAIGLLLVVAAGILVGTVGWPIKVMRSFKYEHWAFICWSLGLVVLPWLAVLLFFPQAFAAYGDVPASLLWKANLFSFSWGIANVLICLCLVRIGFSLTVGLATGIGLPIGVMIPMVFKGSGLFLQSPELFSQAGCAILTGVAILLVAVGFATCAGFGRDAALNNEVDRCNGGFAAGLAMVVAAGLFQAGLSFAFVYSQGPIITAFQTRGASSVVANIGVWAITLPGGALVCILHPAYLMTRNKSWKVLKDHPAEIALSAIIAVTYLLFIITLGEGMRLMGPLGASVGFGVYQALQVSAAQVVAVIAGEWRGVHGKPRRQMIASLVLMIVGVAVLAVGQAF